MLVSPNVLLMSPCVSFTKAASMSGWPGARYVHFAIPRWMSCTMTPCTRAHQTPALLLEPLLYRQPLRVQCRLFDSCVFCGAYFCFVRWRIGLGRYSVGQLNVNFVVGLFVCCCCGWCFCPMFVSDFCFVCVYFHHEAAFN